jgi:hypothetical protein
LQNKLSQLFAQWEHDLPIISGMRAKGKLKVAFSIGKSLGLLIKDPSASSIDCPDCSRRCRVDYLRDASGSQQAFIHCRDCGLSKDFLRAAAKMVDSDGPSSCVSLCWRNAIASCQGSSLCLASGKSDLGWTLASDLVCNGISARGVPSGDQSSSSQ